MWLCFDPTLDRWNMFEMFVLWIITDDHVCLFDFFFLLLFKLVTNFFSNETQQFFAAHKFNLIKCTPL